MVTLKMFWKPLSILAVEMTLGKKLSILYGLTLGFPFYTVILIVMIWELAQIPIIYYLFGLTTHKIEFLNKFKKNMIKKTKKQKIFINLRKHGIWGVAALALYPFPGGGIFSSVLLANILRLEKRIVYVVVVIFTIFSLLILAGLSTLILQGIAHPLLNMMR